jgi:hypothetical protein
LAADEPLQFLTTLGEIPAKPEMETQIKLVITKMLAAIKSGDGQTVAEAMAELDGCLEQERTTLHPQLVHFLENRSYAKALMFLGGETDIPVGVCGGGRVRS